MDFTLFLVQTVLISLSGVMAPGPMSAAAVARGSRSPHAGALMSLGHGIVEIPLMVLLLAGFGAFVRIPLVGVAIGAAGGAFLLWMGIDMLRSMRRSAAPSQAARARSGLVDGIVLSAGNPYFLVWWAAVGMTLITQARAFGIQGFTVFALVHWMCDLAWLWFLSALSFHGDRFFGGKLQTAVSLVCGILLIAFGGRFLADAAVKLWEIRGGV